MKDADCFVFTTRWEGFGLVVVEALAAELPLIVSAHTACGEIVTDGVNGLTVEDPENPEEIALGMRRMMEDTVLREKIISNCGTLPFDVSIEHNVDEFLKLTE